MEEIKFSKKFGDRELDEFIDNFFKKYNSNPQGFLFDLTETEQIRNQELLVLSSIFKSLYESGIKFKVLFFKEGKPFNEVNRKVKLQIIQFWHVWKIWQIVPQGLLRDYFGIDGNTIKVLQEELKYSPKLPETYGRHDITPFVSFPFINHYNENDIQEIIKPVYRLNAATKDLLYKNNCSHPFTSNSLSTIITEELYLNFLDHSMNSSFEKFHPMAFMSISLQEKLNESIYSQKEIQDYKRLNFHTECLDESIDFFFDKKTKKFKNKPYIQFSFLDFGQGIVNTLNEQFPLKQEENNAFFESNVLRKAFDHDTSRHPIFDEKHKVQQFIPRGLFDSLSIAKRYSGLLIARSNYGKILFDFSNKSNISNAFSYFEKNNTYFPGTLISLYIPAIEDEAEIDISSIKPEYQFAFLEPQNKRYLNINSLIEELRIPKEELYTKLTVELKRKICVHSEHSLVFVSFKGSKIPRPIIKKTIYFLLADYDINHKNNVVIINSPPEDIIKEISNEILVLNEAIKNYKLHPLPIIDFADNQVDLEITWLGIYDDEDKEKLNQLIYEQYSIAKTDFTEPQNIVGHLNFFDSGGNFMSVFPSEKDIINFFKHENDVLNNALVKDLFKKHKCINADDGKSLYLCNNDYYQREYVELSNLLNDKIDCNTITKLLFEKLRLNVENLFEYNFISISSPSQRLLKSLELQGLIKIKENDLLLDNYHISEDDLTEDKINKDKKYILVCDVISTGELCKKLNSMLNQWGTSIEYILVVSSTLHPEFITANSFLEDFNDKVFYLYQYPIRKFKREELGKEIFTKSIIRINPYTNIPIRLSIDETNFKESVIFRTSITYSESEKKILLKNELLDSIDNDDIHIGFYEFNNVIHPYFFNTAEIIKKLDVKILEILFQRINHPILNTGKIQICYPRKSGIANLNFISLTKVLGNQNIGEIEIERFNSSEGWRFPHNTDYLRNKIENCTCLIFDDGSCTGDSLIQMIDEICFYEVSEILVICLIARLHDHKREFFSRLSNIKAKDGIVVPISIYFISHWHIPTYFVGENPFSIEKEWLEKVNNFLNVPHTIKKIASNILKEIKPKTQFGFKDYRYLPRIKETKEDKKIPKKEMLAVREELGKVIGYRVYRESFIYFDNFIKKYQTPPDIVKDYFQEIELLCATFIYEPYLFDKMCRIMPDVTKRVQDFIFELIFSNRQTIYPRLTYQWDKKDILHLFFIVFKNQQLIYLLKDTDNLKRLVSFVEGRKPYISYILYKLLRYFPLNESEFNEKKYDNHVKEIIMILQGSILPDEKEVRRFANFINTLPARMDFESQLNLVKENYKKQASRESHVEHKSFDSSISLSLAVIRDCVYKIENNEPLVTERVDFLIEEWFSMASFINPILQFTSSFRDFFSPFPYFSLLFSFEDKETSLRGLVGSIEKTIFSVFGRHNDKQKLEELEKNLLNIQTILRIGSSKFYGLINNRKSNFNELFTGICTMLESEGIRKDVTGDDVLTDGDIIMIPKLYSEKLIKSELINNIKNHSPKDRDFLVEINIYKPDDSTIILKIKNPERNDDDYESSFEGIKCLKLLSDSKLFYFTYDYKIVSRIFIQELIFKVN